MLAALSIRDIVLIERLDLDFKRGLTVLTGETGAGKSILLDSLSLALGARGDAALVRSGCEQGQVTAVFDLQHDHPARALLAENAIAAEGDFILRRVQSRDGRSRAFVNDNPVSIGLLRTVGQLLVEIHGQHDDRALINPQMHRNLLDAFAGNDVLVRRVADAWSDWRAAERECDMAQARLETARGDEAYLRHAVEEIEALAPDPGEEQSLSESRQTMMTAEKLAGDLNEAMAAVSGDDAADIRIAAILRRFERRVDEAPAMLQPVCDALAGALDALDRARGEIEQAERQCAFEPRDLERVEERLFALRALARKHDVSVDDVAARGERMRRDLELIDSGEEELIALRAAVSEAVLAFDTAAADLSRARQQAAATLDAAVNGELAPLKLDMATFSTRVEGDSAPGDHGVDSVAFWVQTNPGTRAGPVLKVASGGELSRILLAIKVSLADRGSAPTLIFDEIDTAVGGAVSDAMGQRLKRLSAGVQVIAITHAPQVAARADTHFRIAKNRAGKAAATVTEVSVLDEGAKREEIARMLAGAIITDEARAAAARLIAHAGA